MNKILIVMTLLSSIFGAKAQKDDSIKLLSAIEFKQEINSSKVQLVDVRTPREFQQGAIKNAINLDFFSRKEFLAGLEKLDKCEPVYLYCHSGGRSAKAARILREQGFEKVYDLQGGYSNY